MSPLKQANGFHERNMEPIAIVGMACRLGEGVNSPSAMWETMIQRELKTAVRVPGSRFNIDAYQHPDAFTRPSSITSPGGAFIDTEPQYFDPEFFDMEDDEATYTDPQHRRMLELVYECIESAGLTKEAIAGSRTGVYVGNFSLDAVVKSCRHEFDRHAHATMSIDPGLVSSKISFRFDLRGPVFTINTGCTSCFFATDTACLALRAGDCDAAIIGGVNLIQSPEQSISISKYGVLSPDSAPLPFDSSANGYLRAEGVGALYLKRLSDAVRDQDPIRGVIRCTQVNSNGSQPGLPMFTPNQESIERMVRDIYIKSNLDPNETAYVEPQGIGLFFADVSEAIGISAAMKAKRSKDTPILIGSLKGNFGHQEAGSGVFSLMKAAMMTEAGVIPGQPNFKKYHPKIDPDKLNIKVPTETIPWPEEYSVRRVGISSWGWSGTNGHMLVEALDSIYPGYLQGKAREGSSYDHRVSRPLLMTFSAHSQKSLVKNIRKHQGLADKYYLADLAYTLNMRRTKFKNRAFAIVSEGSKNEEWAPDAMTFGQVLDNGREPTVGFMFADPRTVLQSGVSDWLIHCPIFLRVIKKLDQIFERLGIRLALEEAIQTSDVNTTDSKDSMSYLQGAAVQIALIDVLEEWKIHPKVSIVGSGGGFAGAYCSGDLSAPEAVLLLSYLVLSEDSQLNTAKHSHNDVAIKIAELSAEELAWRRPRTPLVLLTPDEAPSVLSHFRTCGLSIEHDSLDTKTLADIRLDTVVEISRSEVPSELVSILPKQIITLLKSRSQAVSFSDALAAAGSIYALGYAVDLEQVNAVHDVDWKPLLLVDLPPYQWDHSKSFLHESHALREERLCGDPYHELLGRRIHGLSPRSMIWKNMLVQDDISWLYGSRPTANLSAALCLSLTIEALTQAFGSKCIHDFSLRGFVFQNALPYIKGDIALELQTRIQVLPSHDSQQQTFLVGIESVRDGRWTIHCESSAILSTHSDSDQSSHATDPGLWKINKSDFRTTNLGSIAQENSDSYQVHPKTIYGCLQHALAPTAYDTNNAVGLKVTEIEEVKLWSIKEQTTRSWTAGASNCKTIQGVHVDVDLADDNGAVALTLRGLQVEKCGETREAFDTSLPPRNINYRIPAFLRKLME